MDVTAEFVVLVGGPLDGHEVSVPRADVFLEFPWLVDPAELYTRASPESPVAFQRLRYRRRPFMGEHGIWRYDFER